MTPTDEQTLSPSAEADVSAVGVAYERHRARALRYARALLGARGEAEDLLHEAFVRLVELAQKGAYDPDRGEGRPLLMRIVRNLCLDRLRRRGREVALDDEVVAVGEKRAPVVSRAFLADLETAVARLPEHHRVALVLRVRDELSYRAIAAKLCASESQVKTWIFRARRRLREQVPSKEVS